MDNLARQIAECTLCRLCENRRHAVPGEGNPNASVMFVGEGPGAEEDRQGRPFVGRAGQVLERMLEAINLTRSNVFIANVVKCRPPENRTPRPDEMQTCSQHLQKQIELVNPPVLVCLGSVAAQTLIDPSARISQVRGNVIEKDGRIIIATWHPAALLRDERLKVDTWSDLMLIRQNMPKEGDYDR